MADYYSILKKTVSGMPSATADSRKLVYAKARMAIDRQLRAINPPPSEEAISRQLSALEAAIDQLESESAPVAVQSPALPQVQAAPPAPRQAPALPVQMPVQIPVQQAQPSAVQRAPIGEHAHASAPRLEAGPGEAPAYDTSLDAIEDLERPVRVRPSSSSANRPEVESGGRSSSLVTMIVLALVVSGLVGGGGYALWRNKEPLLAALGLGGTASDKAGESIDGEAKLPIDGEKEDTRLGDGGEEIPAAKAGGTDEAENGTAPAETPGTEESDLPLPAGETEEPAAVDAQVKPVEDEPVQQAQAPAVPSEPAGPQTAQAAIGQKAYLYEEGATGAGATRDNAAVVWSLEQQPPADGVAPEAVIKGKLDVPGRGLVMDILIKRNVDEALPASHIIELFFQAPADFSGGSIDNVARFVMKANEQARGEGLVAVPAKIDTGYFLIALNNLEQAKDTNKRLLVDSSWIDIPLGYTTGRRALVTLEKGAIGDKVFKDAFADWDKR